MYDWWELDVEEHLDGERGACGCVEGDAAEVGVVVGAVESENQSRLSQGALRVLHHRVGHTLVSGGEGTGVVIPHDLMTEKRVAGAVGRVSVEGEKMPYKLAIMVRRELERPSYQ